jgi:L-rhamnose-H+ transport protein
VAPNPCLGLLYHWTGGLAAASFYIPYKAVHRWSWETYWLVGGFFSWIIAPLALAGLLVPDLLDILRQAPAKSVALSYFWGLMWGVGGLTFGLSMRYLGIALGYAIALGLCTAFGTLMPPFFTGQLDTIAAERSGQTILWGVAVCLVGIAISGLAGVSKERELSAEQKQGAVTEFHFLKGLLVATFAGVMSAAFAYGLAAGKPIAEIAAWRLEQHASSNLWQNLPVLVVILLGGFTTNFLWCVALNIKNRSGHEYVARRGREVSEISATKAVSNCDREQFSPTRTDGTARGKLAAAPGPLVGGAPVPLLSNYLFAALAGVIWYLQFFFYSMGQTKMGKYEFSSWTLHMASIIIFSTLWGVALHEWQGTSRRTHALIAVGLAVLIGSTLIIGYGNYLKGL